MHDRMEAVDTHLAEHERVQVGCGKDIVARSEDHLAVTVGDALMS